MKRNKLILIITVIAALCAVLCITTNAASGVKAECTLGDADADGYITVSDARLILRVAIGLNSVPKESVPMFDLDGSNSADVSDARLVLRIAISLDKAPSHTVVETAEKPATCKSTGLSAGSYCKICGKIFEAQTELPVVDHKYSETVVEPTCTSGGYTLHTCVYGCGTTYTDSYTDATPHTWKEITVTKKATCTEDGIHTVRCTVCRKYDEEAIPATGHTVVTDEAVAPTCTKTGLTEGAHCSECGEILTAQETVAATGHTLVTIPAVEPTCSAPGYTEGIKCSVCGEEIKEIKFVKTLDHTKVYDEPVPATCTEAGLTGGYHCSVCGTVINSQKVVPATGHTTEKTEALEPTCTQTGNTEYYTCTVCGNFYKDADGRYKTTAEEYTIPALGHIETTVEGKKPTCTEDGYSSYIRCTRCGETLTQSAVILKLGHNEVTVPGKAATCTEAGYTDMVYCDRCNITLTKSEKIPALGHNPGFVQLDGGMHQKICLNGCGETYTQPEKCIFTEIKVEPTCTQKGGRKYVCNTCGRTVTVNDTPANGHTKGTAVTENYVAPACEAEGGYDTVTYCTVCGEELSRIHTAIAATGHTEAKAVSENTVLPACEDEGSYDSVVYCPVCGKELSRQSYSIPATGHTPVKDAAVEPTCTEEGRTEGSHCKVCRKVLVPTEVIPAKGHTPVTVKGTAPTCTKPGYSDYSKCSVCGTVIEERKVIAALGHDPVSVPGKDATCTEAGFTSSEICSRCNATLTKAQTIPATGHTVVTDAAVTPTCTTDGKTEGSHCSVCGTVIKAQTVIKAEGHRAVFENDGRGNHRQYCTVCGETLIPLTACTYADTVIAPTCTEDGYTEHKCTVCGYTYTDAVTQAAGHKEVTDEAVSPTCTADGKTAGSHCETCGEIIKGQEVIPATGHKEITEKGIPATCTQDGTTDYIYCEICNTVIQAKTVIPAKGHTPVCTSNNDGTHSSRCSECGEIIAENESCNLTEKKVNPTCTETGSKWGECAECGYKTGPAEIPATGHTPVTDTGTAPTCTQTGLTGGTHCSVCGAVITEQEVIPANGHSFGEWEHFYDENGRRCHTRKCTVCGHTETGVCTIEMITATDGTVTFACKECSYTVSGESIADSNRNTAVPYLRKELN